MDIKLIVLNGYKLILLVNFITGDDLLCPTNIKSCYNCGVVPGCIDNEYNNIPEEECLGKLTSRSEIWSVEYVYTSGYCREHSCGDIKIEYKEGSVIHRKTCDISSCADYTLTITNFSTVSSAETSFFYNTGPKDWECLSHCLSTSSACTVSYETSQEECSVYTDCLDSCTVVSASGTRSVYTKSCGNNLTGTTTSSTSTTTSPSPTTTTSSTTAAATTTTTTTSVTTTTGLTATSTTPPAPAPPPATSSSTNTTSTSITTTTTTSITTLSPISTSASSKLPKLYISPCICYTNKTFNNLTEDEIIALLINDMKIDTKATSLAKSKLKSSHDPRTSSKVIGTTGLAILCVLGGIMLCFDLLTMQEKIRSKKNVSPRKHSGK